MPPKQTEARSHDLLTIKVSSRAATRLRARHPWVYRSDLIGNQQTPRAALVHVTDERGKFLGSALSSSSSQIALRIISEHPLQNDQQMLTLLDERLASAIAFRQRFINGSEAYRVVYSEADRLPGLIIDRYADLFTVLFLTQAMDRDDIRAAVFSRLRKDFGKDISIVERVEPRIRELEELPPLEPTLRAGKQTATRFTMNGLSFGFDAFAGQKTGAFLDQRENYAAAERYAHGDALDVFCYQGGFALHLARACKSVVGVDASREALEAAEANANSNAAILKVKELEWLEANAFDLLKDYSSGGKKFDTIVLDPPAFAKSKRTLDTALRGYKELNLRALKMLRPGGVLITNSCSHHVSESEFLQMVAEAAVDAKRSVRILEKRIQSQDHPVLPEVPETLYLKCLILAVE